VDTLCGIGLPELIILALLGFVLIGPERSREVALKLGRFLRSMMTSAWWREFNQIRQALRDLPTTLVRMAEIEEVQAELKRTVGDIGQAATIDFSEGGKRTATGKQPERSGNPWGIKSTAAQASSTEKTGNPSSPTENNNSDDPRSF
jgi:Sec-independent protein translocase protein TatA